MNLCLSCGGVYDLEVHGDNEKSQRFCSFICNANFIEHGLIHVAPTGTTIVLQELLGIMFPWHG